MIRFLLSIVIGGCCFTVHAQTVSRQLQNAFDQFAKDPQLKHAISSLYVIDAATGATVFEKNSLTGLAPASTQKIITSITAFELLGKDFRYKTTIGYEGKLVNDSLDGFLSIKGSGDPSFGSWRYDQTKPEYIMSIILQQLKKQGIQRISGDIYVDRLHFDPIAIPDGWIWQDIGNYYGAGSWSLNWRENQYDMQLRSGDRVGDNVEIVSVNGQDSPSSFINYLKAGAKGTGDNAYIYLETGGVGKTVSGTIPVSENNFKISGASHDGPGYFRADLSVYLKKNKFISGLPASQGITAGNVNEPDKIIYTHYSPTLDSLIYWFNKKSINLYGEALIKTLAFEKDGYGKTEKGLDILRKFWETKGLSEDELGMVDGSGLSPLNRVTTHAQVTILKYAKSAKWFASFYDALPLYNGMRMKSGTISGAKGFCGYHKAANGKEYIFSFLVNNYSGSAGALVSKMYKVLDTLK